MMAEKVKRPPFFTLKRWQSAKEPGDIRKSSLTPTTPTPPSQGADNPPMFRPHNPSVGSRTVNFNLEPKPRKLSAGGIKELIQCSLCLEVLHNPKMLPCQHTFCTACLSVYIADLIIFDCPICRTRVQVLGPNFVENLPSNLYIDSLLQLVGIQNGSIQMPKNQGTPPATPTTNVQNVDLFASGGVRCVHCKTVCDSVDITQCNHCKLKFCRVCWSQHLEDMRIQLKSIVKQLDTAASHLEHKIEHYKDRCDRIAEQIRIAADEKIAAIFTAKDKMLMDAANLQKSSEMSAIALQASLDEAKSVANKAMETSNSGNESDRILKFTYTNTQTRNKYHGHLCFLRGSNTTTRSVAVDLSTTALTVPGSRIHLDLKVHFHPMDPTAFVSATQ